MSAAPHSPSYAPNAAFAWWWYCGHVVAVSLLVLFPVWLKTAQHGFHNYDLGIFAQALQAIRLDDLNPFLPALNMPIFNDHFDPILILFAPLARLLPPAYAALTIEHMLVLLSPLPILLLCRKAPHHFAYACLATTYLLFNRGMMSALSFPVHPTTWASFFIVLFAMAAAERRHGMLLVSSVLLMACKEEFPFVVATVGVCLVCRKDFRIGIAILALSLIWCLVAFGVRPMFAGETHHYASRVLTPILTDPFTTLGTRLSDLKGMKRLFQCVLPLIPLVVWGIRNRISPNWVLLSGALPLLAIRFLDGAWSFHYMAPVAALFAVGMWRKDQPRLPFGYVLAGALMAILTSISPISKGVATYGTIRDFGGKRMTAIEDARFHLLRETNGNALVEGNLTPLLARRKGVFQVGGVQPAQEYRFLLTEKPPGGDPWPLNHADIQEIMDDWRSRSSTVIHRDDDFVFFAEYRTVTPEWPNRVQEDTTRPPADPQH